MDRLIRIPALHSFEALILPAADPTHD